MTESTLTAPTIQQRFAAFAASPAARELSDLEFQCLFLFQSHANPETAIVAISCGRIARTLTLKGRMGRETAAVAVDSLASKGFLETVEPGVKFKCKPAVRRINLPEQDSK